MSKEEIKAVWDLLLAQFPHLSEADTLDWKIRESIENIILAVAPEAIVYPFDALNHKPEEWAGLFAEDASGDIKKVHGYVIKRADIDPVWVGNNVRTKTTYAYDVWGYHGFYEATSRINNSDKKFQKTLDHISLLAKRLYNFGDLPGVEQHTLLKFKRMTSISGGNEQMHYAPGRIAVELCG